MNPAPVWFERKFEFNFPVELHPNLCTRLRGTPARLEELVRGARHDVLTAKPLKEGKEKWSAQEHVGHLLDLEWLWMKRLEDYLTDGLELTPTDLRNRKTDEANHNAQPLDRVLKEFREARSRLVRQVETVEADAFSRTRLHPRLKQPMRLVDHLYFVAEHDDHHLACVWEMIEFDRARG